MIYAIAVCLRLGLPGAGSQCHVDDFIWTSPFTFDSAQACLAYLPRILDGKRKVSADGRLYMNAGWYECVAKQTWQPVQPKSVPSPPKRYVIAMCFETEALAKAANPENWKPGDSCIQMMPGASPESGLDCLTDLIQAAKPAAKYDIVDVGNVARFYRHSERHVWLQCYQTGP